MSRSARVSAAATAAILVLVTPGLADAFCGFYVGGSGTKMYNNATQVVLMREGTRTVLSMQNNYQGPPKDFALVVPVPVVLKKENVKTLERKLFDRIDRLSAPRLVEYWEKDPCEPPKRLAPPSAVGFGGWGGGGLGGGGGGFGMAVRIEAKFAVGEYKILILSATDSTGLERWLRARKYNIPRGAATYLRPYIQSGSKFFVAKVDVAKVKFVKGQAMLSPLRVHYDSKTFNLPIRLGLMNAKDKQDLIVHILAKGQRYEVANYKNVTIPTNIGVRNGVRKRFASFYAALFDKTLAKNPGAVVTEYAWDSASCDPCPTPPLSSADLVTLGADVLYGKSGAGAVRVARGGPKVSMRKVTVRGALDGATVRRYLRRHLRRIEYCYTSRGLLTNPNLRGKMKLRFVISRQGRVVSVMNVGGSFRHAGTTACIRGALRRIRFPTTRKVAMVTLPLVFGGGGGLAFRSGSFDMVLTRLHARYGKGGMKDDLTFRKATPIIGGREIYHGGKLEERSRQSSTNNFQARYIIRHRWRGAIACKNPIRNRWGGPPGGGAKPKPKPATGLAFVPRTGFSLLGLIAEAVPELGLQPSGADDDERATTASDGSAGAGASGAGAGSAGGTTLGGAGTGTPRAAPRRVALKPTGPAAAAAPPPTAGGAEGGETGGAMARTEPVTVRKKKGCGCASVAGPETAATLFLLFFALAWIRRRR